MNLHHVLIRLARRGLIAFCTLLALLALLGSHSVSAFAATTPSFIRLINASPDVGTMDVFVDGAIFLENANYASVTDYLQLPSGPHKVELALVGKGLNAPVLDQKLSVQPGVAYTVAAIGTKSTGFSLQVFVDDNRMAIGKATVRVYDLSRQSGVLNVTTASNTLISSVSYGKASNYQKLAAGLYTFTFSSSQPVFTIMDQVTLKTNMVTSLFLIGVFNGTPSLQVIPVQVKGLPSLLAGTGSDPNALPVIPSRYTPLPALPLGVLILAGIAVVLFARFWPFPRQKRSPRRLFGAALGAILALVLSLTGLSFAAFVTHPSPAPTARLLIPAIGVNAAIESVGIRPNGAMDTPRQNPWSDVGLYTGGSHPGQRGSTVIAGHLDRPGGSPAVFWRLRDLQVGDEVQVVDAQGKVLLYHVTRIAMYPLQNPPVQDIFGNTNGTFLNLTTCAGDWIPTQHQMTMRLVVYTSVGPGSVSTATSTAALTSFVPLTLPLLSPHVAHSTAVPSSSSSSTYSTSSASSYSTLVPSPLPVALRPTTSIKLPGASTNVAVQRTIRQGKQSSTSSAPPLLSRLLHQVSNPLTRTPVVGNLLRQVSSSLTRTPVVGKLLQQVNSSLTRTPVVGNSLQQVSNTLTHAPVVGKSIQQVSNTLTHTPVVGKSIQQVSNTLTHTPVVGKSIQQVSNTLTHTPVVGNSLHQVNNTLTHTPVVGKSIQQTSNTLTHTPVVGNSVNQTNSPLNQISSSQNHTPVTGNPVNQTSSPLNQTNNSQTHTPVMGNSVNQTSSSQTHTPVRGNSVNQTSSSLTHTSVTGNNKLPNKGNG